MRAALWLLVLFGVAVASALFAGNNQGTVTLFWPPHRIDLSLNLVLLLLALGFVTLYAALRALNALLALPRRARRWRLHQKERTMHAAILDAMALFLAGRFLRSRKTALEALAQENGLTQAQTNVPHARQLRALAHLVCAEASQALQDHTQRDHHLAQALHHAPELGSQPERELREGIHMRAAHWSLSNREPQAALDWLGALPQGAARRTLALRMKLKAARHAHHTQSALDTARLLSKHRAFSANAGESIVRGLAMELIDEARDPAQLERAWQSLDAAERAMPELTVHAAQRLSALNGDAATVRQWLLPVWQTFANHPNALSEQQASRLVRALDGGLDDVDGTWLARIEAAAQAHPRNTRLQYLAGMACLKRQLWGKAQQLLTQSAQQLPDAQLRRSAWQHLAELAERRGDTAAAAQAWKQAALAWGASG